MAMTTAAVTVHLNDDDRLTITDEGLSISCSDCDCEWSSAIMPLEVVELAIRAYRSLIAPPVADEDLYEHDHIREEHG